MRAAIPLIALMLAANSGCTTDGWFSRKPGGDHPIQGSNLPKADLENAARVDLVGRKILAANPELKINPLFMTVGSKSEAVFHDGPDNLCITEGLVRKCPTDAELASVLANELALMQVEKISAAPRQRPNLPPPLPNTFNDVAGSSVTADQTRQAELAHWEKDERRRERAEDRVLNADAEVLARDYVMKAGYDQAEYTKALPLVRCAQSKGEQEKEKLGVSSSKGFLPNFRW